MDALYFPHFSLPPSTWVNPTLLFFDQLAAIAPEALGGHGQRNGEYDRSNY